MCQVLGDLGRVSKIRMAIWFFVQTGTLESESVQSPGTVNRQMGHMIL